MMWPSLHLPGGVSQSLLHSRVIEVARSLLGQDMKFDFDMVISKEAGSTAETPWHQVTFYYLNLNLQTVSLTCMSGPGRVLLAGHA